jgi:hypothetical protein
MGGMASGDGQKADEKGGNAEGTHSFKVTGAEAAAVSAVSSEIVSATAPVDEDVHFRCCSS